MSLEQPGSVSISKNISSESFMPIVPEMAMLMSLDLASGGVAALSKRLLSRSHGAAAS